ncbi:MAG: DNA polymerase IV [Candidatus Saganbacteria bacterium]|nr:DNA polymerase IV [Candidatus Saganbacteria bacterium]
MKTILHLDMNAFFASVEQAANPALKGKPIVVGGGIKKGSVVAAASYEAKAFGIKNGMSTWEAKRLCPHLITVIGDMAKYIYTSKIITGMLRDYTDLVEIFSIDEAFMDISKTKNNFGGEIKLAQEIKKRIKKRFGLTCNIGIGPNKLMAKLAGELKKPDGLIILKKEDIPEKIKDVAVKKLCGIGKKTEKYLAELGVKTFGQLNKYPREKLVKRFGLAYGEQLYQMGQGNGSSTVAPYYKETHAKSMGHSYTLPKLTNDMDQVKGYLLRLSEQVGRRLRRDNYRGNVIHLSLGFGNYKFWGKQKKIEDYINDGYRIFKLAEKTLDQRTTTDDQIRFVGVSVSNLIHNLDQISIFEPDENKKRLLKTIDKLNNRYGEFTIERASIMETILQGKTGMVSPKSYHLNE